MKNSQLVPDRDTSSALRRLRNGWRLVISRHVPRADLELRCGNTRWQASTDRHGYFFSCHEIDQSDESDELWSQFDCRVSPADSPPIEATGTIMRASDRARRIIISDIDDTVVHTGVANKLRMFWELYFARSGERMPFPGMSAFLQGLHGGADGEDNNPMLYVSRSPWSIYPVLDDFFNRHNIPLGPVLLLRDWGISWRHPLPRRAADHKASMIDRVMQAYSHLPAVLIGDSGQHDPEVYLDVIERYPGRIEGVYIRDLSLSQHRSSDLAAAAERLSASNVHFFAATDTDAMARDAAARGWIQSEACKEIHQRRLAEVEA